MKRFLSVILTIAMLVSATPAVFADAAADEDNAVITEELKKDENSEVKSEEETKITEDEPEEPQEAAEPEETEEISTMSAENGIALFAENEENEVEYEIKNQDTNWEWKSYTGTLKEALTIFNESGNAGKIKLLKDIEVEDTIGTSSNSTYSTVSLTELDGNNHKITRKSSFTGDMIKLADYTCTIKNVTLDGGNVENCGSLIVAPAVGNSKGTHLILQDVTLLNNTNSAIKAGYQVEGSNVKIENCSAKYGGAIYFESGAISAVTANFTNSTFTNNSADTGSVAYLKSSSPNVFTARFDGCTFSSNTFTDDESNTDTITKSSVIYAYANVASGFNSVTLAGTTKFSNNTVNSDVLIDGNLSNKITSTSSVSDGGLNVGDNFSTVNPIKVAVGSFERENYTDGGLVVYLDSADSSSNFKLVDVNDSNKISTGGKLFMIKQSGTANYLVIGSPRKIDLYFNCKTKNINSVKTLSKFNSQLGNIVTLTTDVEFNHAKNNFDVDIDQAVENVNYVINAKANNVRITSYYVQYKNTVRENGTIDASGSSATLNLTPEILSVAADSNPFGNGTVTFYIEYEVLAQPITIKNVTGGTISTNPAGSANAGDTVTLTYAADAGYKFDGWNVYKTDDTSTTVPVTDNSFKMPGYGVTVSAKFVKNTHDVTITKEGEGTVSISPETPVEVGATVNVTAEPSEDWELSSLTMNGTDITSAKSFTMPDSDVVIKAVFVKKKFNVNITNVTGGTIKLLYLANPIEWDTMVTINVQAEAHYEIDTVTVGGENVTDKLGEQGDYTFIMPANDVSISATFKKKKYRMTTSGDHATFTPADGEYEWGETVTFTAVPEKWYSIKNVSADDSTVNLEPVTGAENTYRFIMPTGDVTITAETVRPNFNVEFVSNGGSSVDGQVIANGNTVTKPSTPTYVNHGFAGWYTSPTFEADTKYDFNTNVTGNVKLYARWFLWGDVNGDGKVTPFDAVQLDRCYVGSINVESLVVPMAARVTDANKTKPTPFDSVQIKRKYVGSLDRFPVEKTSYEYDLENNKVITE